MRRLIFAAALVLAVAPVFAQAPVVDHWWTPEECQGATAAPYYIPRVKNAKPVKGNEMVVGHPSGGCFEIDLPKEDGGRGWVRLEKGRRLIQNITTGKYERLEECNNGIYGFVPFIAEKPAPTEAAKPYQESTAMPDAINRAAATLADSIKNAAATLKPEQIQPAEAEPPRHHPNFFSLKRKSGKIFWSSVAAGAVVCGFECRFTQTQITNVVVGR